MPQRVESGTSLEAKGILKPPPNAQTEQGSARVVLTRDVTPDLANRTQAVRTYDKMCATDATVDVALRAAKVPIQGATYYVQPFSDNQLDIDVAEFVEENLFGGTTAPWLITLEEILRMFEYGFSVLEPVYEVREWSPNRQMANRRKYTMLRKLAPRPASTIKDFTYDDNGGPVNVIQNAIDASGNTKEVTIPIDKCIIFTFNKKGGDLFGKSLLRTAYKHWYYKENFYKIDAIQKERHALGVPTMGLPPEATDKDYDTAWELVRNVRANEEAGAVFPINYVFDIKWPTGQPINVLESIEHHDARIMLNVMGQFLLLGLSGSGSRATGGSHVDMFQKSLKFCANLVCDCMNLYLIPRLVAFNFDTGGSFPQLRVRNIGETKDTQMWASALANLASQNLLTLDFETEQWVREQIDAPFKLGGKQTPENNAREQAIFQGTRENPNAPSGSGGASSNGNQSSGAAAKGGVGKNGGQGNAGTPPGAA